jgi:hypothetical protein
MVGAKGPMHHRRAGLVGAAGAALTLSMWLPSTVAVAQPPPAASATAIATADDRKQAAREFADGDRAFKEGDYRQAAEAYERAYQRVPHHSALWNAARSWHRAGELAKAANLYARYLREAPPGARDRNNAQKALNELSNKLARLEIHATDVADVKLDGAPLALSSVFVTPGEHVLEGRTHEDRVVRQAQTVETGDVVSVALVPPAVAVAPSPSVVATAPQQQPRAGGAAPSTRRGWSPIVVYFEGAVTLALAGITVWSGIDTLQQKDAFDRSPTPDNLDVGRQKQTRTNLLIGASAAAGAVTALTALLLVDWHGGDVDRKEGPGPEPRVGLGAGLGTLSVQGAF